jgi:hypothetical protein
MAIPLTFGKVSAQSLDNLKDQKPLLLNGFVSTNQVINAQPTDSGNISTYNSYYTGSLNFSIYGINTPLTFMYSNNQGDFTHPFNQFGLHPSYKWIKGHIGYASMSFSPYTLNGHLFLGTGVEIDPPGIFYGSAMYGRLKKAVDYDTTNYNQLAAYKRMGYGFKVGIADDGNFIDVSLFRAYDVENSINNTGIENQLLPQDNSVMSVSFNKELITNLVFQGEFASSYLSTDTRTERVIENNALLKPPTWFMPSRTSTINRNAFNSNLTYCQNRYSLGLGYERVDPEYKTLGAYYFTNNMENMTLNFSANFFENKISIGGNTGLQKDNLDNSKMNNTKRFVGAGNVNYVPGEKLNLNVAYSNFTSFTNVRSTFDYINETDPYQNFDTLNFRQISQNTNFIGSYLLSNSKEKRQTLNLNLTWQVSNDEQGGDSVSTSNFYNASASYIINLTPLGLTCNTSVNYNRNEVTEAGSHTLGPVIGVSKLFFDKTFRTSITTSYSTSKTENFPSSNVFNVRMGLAYTLKKKHHFNTNVLFQQRESATKSYNTLNFTFGYVYNFNVINQKQNVSKNE